MPDKFNQRMDAVLSDEDDTESGRAEIWITGVQALEDVWLTLTLLTWSGYSGYRADEARDASVQRE
jgi:hypothetical protein